jgi:hypothetical protein
VPPPTTMKSNALGASFGAVAGCTIFVMDKREGFWVFVCLVVRASRDR